MGINTLVLRGVVLTWNEQSNVSSTLIIAPALSNWKTNDTISPEYRWWSLSTDLSTIVGSREQSDQLSLGEEFISIFNDLVQEHTDG
jgi:hypothetical protein